MFVEEASSYLAYQRQSQHLMLLSYFILKKALAPGKFKWQIRLGSKLKTFLSLLILTFFFLLQIKISRWRL